MPPTSDHDDREVVLGLSVTGPERELGQQMIEHGNGAVPGTSSENVGEAVKPVKFAPRAMSMNPSPDFKLEAGDGLVTFADGLALTAIESLLAEHTEMRLDGTDSVI